MDFIERFLHISLDQGSGTLEFSFMIAATLVSLLAGLRRHQLAKILRFVR
jgi:hypothetical protein